MTTWRRLIEDDRQQRQSGQSGHQASPNARTTGGSTMNVYLAARYGRRRQMQGIARQIEARGHMVTSRWILGEHDSLDGDASPDEQMRWAEEDVEDIMDASVLLTITEEPGADGAGRGGRHVELGVALGQGLPVLLVGPTEHVFHHHPRVIQCLSIAHALDVLDDLQLAHQASISRIASENAERARQADGGHRVDLVDRVDRTDDGRCGA